MTAETEILVADIGGTHARFALAQLQPGKPIRLDAAMRFEVAAYRDLESAFTAFGRLLARPLPRAAAFAVAAPIGQFTVRFTNNPWSFDPEDLRRAMGLDTLLVVNDLAAVAHAVVEPDNWQEFVPLYGARRPLCRAGTTTVIGIGTGLGVAQVICWGSHHHVIATEGGHVGFSPHDPSEEALIARLRPRGGYVSAERLISGPGLAEFLPPGASYSDDRTLWEAAIAGSDPDAREALDRFALALGNFVGDAALMHGSYDVVLAGSLANRLADFLPDCFLFGSALHRKERSPRRMKRLSVKLLTLEEPGLFGAALAFVETQRAAR